MNKPLLLDSHIFLWLLQDSKKIGPKTKQLLEKSPKIYISLATIWELGIKHQKGKLAFDAVELLSVADKLEMEILAIKEQHVVSATRLDIKNKDPFDRMITAQSHNENSLLITADLEIIGLGLDHIVDARN